MKKLKDILIDFGKSIIVGGVASIVIAMIVSIIALIACGFDLEKILNAISSTVMIIGSFGLLLVAILILKNRKEKSMKFINQWKSKFNVFTYKVVFLVISIEMLVLGSGLDYIVFYNL